MNRERFQTITSGYTRHRIAVVGDFCLDRYLEIDPAKAELSIETGLPVHNVVNVRAQAGGAGTIANNLAALKIRRIVPLGFAGDDGEGLELSRALAAQGMMLDHFVRTPLRRTFTYCKPLLIGPGKQPVELNRLDTKNWDATPQIVETNLIAQLQGVARSIDGMIVLDQVSLAGTGVITKRVLEAIAELGEGNERVLIIADSRRGLKDFRNITWKMNLAELASLVGATKELSLQDVERIAVELARDQKRMVFVTLAEKGLIGATPAGESAHAPALPVRGEIDIVGAGDSVTANLTAALLSGASLMEALEIATAAASVVIHKLGTTGTASVQEIEREMFG
jgi:rfaE bifunctional protein kinase chain/domain